MGKREFAVIANGDLALHHFGDTTSAPQRTASDDCQAERSLRRLPQFGSAQRWQKWHLTRAHRL